MTNGKITSYRDLKVWQFAIELSVVCYEVTRTFPREEIYGLTSQIRRSSASVAANIAEGYGRENRGSFAQFLKIAQGSLKELETHLIIAGRIGFLQASALDELLDRCDEIGKMLGSLIRSVQHRKS
ncbi:four helix bundle protein [Rhizobium leguminosarum]|uniref:four helix bundle protein n=1 Tax=Rhizobium leguminosarum TaxID=384 RepID=UPI0013C100B7|nr:four helix bundle protein [Rhizobium leguminosarum]MBY5316463.1 four helix bundle protein [Rhizobium leguminosarum]MBY5397455.1 four helix bundle protein [Rhizobium leguminosarum]NEH51790.1 four helix bundle protein [Rhizobium leguminosarum]NEH58987.1 four helix bundle protein [Rhizobium leguminosarum]NKK81382.1 four helix bundle protein [Rhizobium leguminosarum bv. viciae]